MKGFSIALFPLLLLLAGCTAVPPVVVDDDEAMTYLEPELRPEPLLFPKYLLMADFEIGRHGRIPNSALVGADLKTKLDLAAARQRFDNLLRSKGWKIVQTESAEHSFRLQASRRGETLEIRAVQGSGPVQVFLLYKPGGKRVVGALNANQSTGVLNAEAGS